MRIHQLVVIAALVSVAPVAAGAQSIKKVGAEVHHTLKKTGNVVKESACQVGAATHRTLKKAGRDSKAELKRTTGAKPIGGDVGKAARQVSKSGKKFGRSAKKEVKSTSSAAHRDLTKTGTEAKQVIKP
jgi:Flp pilus assembly pilin Flp